MGKTVCLINKQCVIYLISLFFIGGCGTQEQGKPNSFAYKKDINIFQKSEIGKTGKKDRKLINEKTITCSIGMEMVLISKGKFMMGSPKIEKERLDDEILHEVTLTRDYYIGAYEVTQEQYEKVMGENPSRFKGSKLPVDSVNWKDAVDFCRNFSAFPHERKAGRKYRLPTEAEWEFACRAGTSTPFNFGTELNGTQANCDGTPPYGTDVNGPNLERTSQVGSYPPNAWGLYDMHGNVWEWCADWYGEYPKDQIKDPLGPNNGVDRVLRGGSWYCNTLSCRTACRRRINPDNRCVNVGFRVLLDSAK